MIKSIHIRIYCLLLILSISKVIIAQDNILGKFITKDQDNKVKLLFDRMNSDKNYLIMLVNLSNGGSLDLIRRLEQQDIYFQTNYNMRILLVSEDYYKQDLIFGDIIDSLDITLPILRTKHPFKEYGIHYTPSEVLVPANSKEIINIYANACGAYDRIFAEHLRFRNFELFSETYFEQYLTTDNCDTNSVWKHTNSNEVIIKNIPYHKIGPLLIHEDKRTKEIKYFDINKGYPIPYLAYDYSVCSNIYLVDAEGDCATVKVIDIIETENKIRLITDKYIPGTCDLEPVPFELVSGIGTNAGLIFDIEEGEIISRLICHYQQGEQVYADPALDYLCQYNATNNDEPSYVLNVFPNPATDYININFSTSNTRFLTIYSMDGKPTLTSPVSKVNNKISLDAIPVSSIYTLEINEQGKELYHQLIAVIKE